MSQYFIDSPTNVGVSNRSNALATKVLPGADFGGKFTNFNILPTVYKVVDGHEIRANLIFPRSIPTGKAPVVVHFHGGGLVSLLPLQHNFIHIHTNVSCLFTR